MLPLVAWSQPLQGALSAARKKETGRMLISLHAFRADGTAFMPL